MNINDYIKSKISKKPIEQNNPKEAYEKYSKLSEEELVNELFRNADNAKENGTLNNKMLDDFYNNAKNYLTPEQSEKMKSLIWELKK